MSRIVPLKHRCEWGVVTYRDGEPSIEWFDTRDDAIAYAEACAGSTEVYVVRAEMMSEVIS